MPTSYAVSLVLIFIAGHTQAVVWTILATLILSKTEHTMRGRVMGLRTGVIASLPLGNLVAGAIAERFGAPIAQGAYAVVAILVMVAIIVWEPKLYTSE